MIIIFVVLIADTDDKSLLPRNNVGTVVGIEVDIVEIDIREDLVWVLFWYELKIVFFSRNIRNLMQMQNIKFSKFRCRERVTGDVIIFVMNTTVDSHCIQG